MCTDVFQTAQARAAEALEAKLNPKITQTAEVKMTETGS
jgi:hypothetical protein